jgi:hypothetical protein
MKGIKISKILTARLHSTLRVFGLLLIGIGYVARSLGECLQKVGAKLRPSFGLRYRTEDVRRT